MGRPGSWASSVTAPAQAIQVGEPLLADYERILGPDHPDTPGLPEQPRRRPGITVLTPGCTLEPTARTWRHEDVGALHVCT